MDRKLITFVGAFLSQQIMVARDSLDGVGCDFSGTRIKIIYTVFIFSSAISEYRQVNTFLASSGILFHDRSQTFGPFSSDYCF